ncbi:hypothetical protein [Ferrimonas futtsuensis]|uniref:hypothetical protein n=1 Tax=Ferrimonas futtsuensis TaxID=364764 RepID=UPI000410CEBE|nr:hypothetical protein [Ferrimonas futtsuensis]
MSKLRYMPRPIPWAVVLSIPLILAALIAVPPVFANDAECQSCHTTEDMAEAEHMDTEGMSCLSCHEAHD